MTAVEWLEKELNEKGKLTPVDFYQAKAMEKQQTFEDFRRGLDISIQEAYRIAQKSWAREHRTQQYYNETYGSKGSDEIEKSEKPINSTSSQTEISDLHSTITDKIDGMIFELPFDDKMKLWELIDELVAESQTEISDEEINKWADDYAFRVPYDGSNDFYDKEAIKHFLNGAKKYREQLKSR